MDLNNNNININTNNNNNNNFLYLKYNNHNGVEKKNKIKFEYIIYINFIINMIDDFGININNLINNKLLDDTYSINNMLIYSNNIKEKSIQIILDLLETILYLQNNYNDYLQLLIQNIQKFKKNKKNKMKTNSQYYILIYEKLKDTLLLDFKDEKDNLNELTIICTEILNFSDFFEIPILIEFINEFISKLIK